VRGVFSRAIHLQFDGHLLVVTDARAPAGPLHLRVKELPVVAIGDEVRVADGRLQLGRHRVDLASVPTWTPPVVAGRPSRQRLGGAERSALAGRPDLLERVRTHLREDDIEAAARLLGGWGPGLTPAGDDVLAGIVLTLHVFGGPPSRLHRAVDVVHSTDLSLAYLHWAARGQCIEPAHSVLAALAGERGCGVDAASARLVGHGASSGADLLLGIECALPLVAPGLGLAARVRTAATPSTPP
jgi:hypothetical protein